MNFDNLIWAIKTGNSDQFLHDVTVSEEKMAAKVRGAELLRRVLPEHAKVLDVGGETFYRDHFPNLVQANLPDEDMHAMTYRSQFNGVVAMHVLEHSPVPLMVLRNIWDALKPGGWVYVAVPQPVGRFVDMDSHWTCLHERNWRKLLVATGFRVEHAEDGRFGDYPEAIEHRFLAQKGANGAVPGE